MVSGPDLLASNAKIYLISRPALDNAVLDQFLSDEDVAWHRTRSATPSEELVEIGGRICYMSFGARQSPRNTSEYIHNLVKMGHESVLEHAVWTFILTGVSRAFSHQLVRHRVGFAFSQLSQQYHDETDARFILPRELSKNQRAAKIWIRTAEDARRAYRQILETIEEVGAEYKPNAKERLRAVRSAARSVLPNATETKLVASANARALRYFLKIRGAILGDVEMRVVSSLLLKLMKKEAPAIFGDFRIAKHTDGTPIVRYHPD